MDTFQIHNVTSQGKRGRPAHPKPVERLRNLILSDRGAELGEVRLEPQSNGSVILTAVIDGKKKAITFPAKSAPRGRKPGKSQVRKATAKATRTRKRRTRRTA